MKKKALNNVSRHIYQDQYELYIIYYYFFMANLHTFLTNQTAFDYDWLDITKEKFISKWQIRRYDNFNRYDNGYLLTNQKNPANLGKDLITRGGFWPFAYRIDLETNKKEMVYGKHRLYGLLSYYNQHPFDKTFLFIKMPRLEERWDIVYDKEITLYTFYRDKVYKIQTDKQWVAEDTWGTIADVLSESFFYMDKQGTPIIPNPILNDPELFQEFITKPFDTENIAYKILIERLKEIKQV